jgi:hypothetical protein
VRTTTESNSRDLPPVESARVEHVLPLGRWGRCA